MLNSYLRLHKISIHLEYFLFGLYWSNPCIMTILRDDYVVHKGPHRIVENVLFDIFTQDITFRFSTEKSHQKICT